MMPSAMGRGEGSEFRSPISIATIGGLITSTLLTLVVVPVAYLLLARTLERVKAWRAHGVRVPQAVRVTGVVLLVAVARLADLRHHGIRLRSRTNGELRRDLAVAASGREGGHACSRLTLTFNQALERALSNNEGLKVAKERVVETQARVQEVKDQLPAAGEPGLQLHAVAALSGDQDPGRRVWSRGTDVPGRLRAEEQPAAVRQPADLHRRAIEQRLRHHHARRSTRRSSSSIARGRRSNIASSRRSTRR